MTVDAPDSIGVANSGGAAVAVSIGDVWTGGIGVSPSLYQNAVVSDESQVLGETMTVGKLLATAGASALEISSTSVTVSGLSDSFTNFAVGYPDPCSQAYGNTDPYYLFSARDTTAVFTSASFGADLVDGGRTLSADAFTSKAELTVASTFAPASTELVAAGFAPVLKLVAGVFSGSCTFGGDSLNHPSVTAAAAASSASQIANLSPDVNCLQVRYADGVNGSHETCVAGFCNEWKISKVYSGDVPVVTISAPTVNPVTADDSGTFSYVPELVSSAPVGSAFDGFSVGTTTAVATLIKVVNGVDTEVLAVSNVLSSAGSTTLSELSDRFEFGGNYRIDVTSTTDLGGGDTIVTTTSRAFTTETDEDFPLVISNLAEGRALRSNLPTGFTMSKADGIDVEIDTCNVTATDSTGASAVWHSFTWPSTGGVQDQSYTITGLTTSDAVPAGTVTLKFACTRAGGASLKPMYRYLYVDDVAPTASAVAWSLADGTTGEFIATPTALIGTNTINLSVSLANSVETLGALGDTLTNAEREIDDEEVRAAPKVATDTYPIELVVKRGGVVAPGLIQALPAPYRKHRVAGVSFENVALGDGSGDTTIEITLSDEAGNQTALTTFTVTVDVDAPVLSISGLTEVIGGVIHCTPTLISSQNDSSPASLGGLAGFQQRFTVNTTGTDGSETVTLTFSGGFEGAVVPDVQSLELSSANGSVTTANLTFTDSKDSDEATVDAPYVVTISSTDAVGNTGTASYAFDVFQEIPTIAWNIPPSSVLNSSNDEDPAAGLQDFLFNTGSAFTINGGSVSLVLHQPIQRQRR